MEKMSLFKGRPVDVSGRLVKEQRVYELLDSLKIEYERVDHEAAETMEQCRAIDEILAPALICKNLFLCNSNKSQYYMLMLPGHKQFKTKIVSKLVHSSRLSFGEAELMEEYLDITPGSVSVLGLMNDKENKVQLIVDEDILKEELFGCHPCINTSSIRLRVVDVFEKFLPAVKHDYITINIE